MNELPDLRSDADVDALMARIQARIAAAAQPGTPDSAGSIHATGALAQLIAAEERLASAVLRALSVVAATLDDIENDSETAEGKPSSGRRPKRSVAVVRTGVKRSATRRRRTQR